MSLNPTKPSRRRAKPAQDKLQVDNPETPDIKEAAVEEPSTREASPIRKPAGKPSVRKRVGRPKIGVVEKVTKPTFGVVRGVYH
jgi:hypothetical protein